jgi:hypothetical protein
MQKRLPVPSVARWNHAAALRDLGRVVVLGRLPAQHVDLERRHPGAEKRRQVPPRATGAARSVRVQSRSGMKL